MIGRRWVWCGLLVVFVALAACGDTTSGAVDAAGDTVSAPEGTDEMQAVAYNGLVFEVPGEWLVQDVTNRLDGELACPDVPGFVFAGTPVSPDAVYTTATCDPPGEEMIVWVDTVDAAGWEGKIERQGELEFLRIEDSQVVFVDQRLRLHVDGLRAEAVLEEILRSARPADADDELASTPTSAAAQTEVAERVANELGCADGERASTFARGGTAFLGRQAEAPLDCHVGAAGFRILVLRDDGAVDEVIAYYRRAWLVVDRADRTVVTALDHDAARIAHARLGGELVPPPDGCCGPPTSDNLPGM